MLPFSRHLGRRLAAVAAFVPPGSRVADVGSDHGRLARALVAGGTATSCIATEWKAGPSARLKQVIASSEEADRIEVRHGDGLTPLRPEDALDVVILAGMGGTRAAGLLDQGRWELLGLDRIVIQPQGQWEQTRVDLANLGCGVIDERIVEERGRFYLILCAAPGPALRLEFPGLDRDEALRVGPASLRRGGEVTRRYWEAEKRLAEVRHASSAGAGRDHFGARIRLCRRVLAAIASGPIG